MLETWEFNTQGKSDFHTDLDNLEIVKVTNGGHLTQIRDNIANLLWDNQ